MSRRPLIAATVVVAAVVGYALAQLAFGATHGAPATTQPGARSAHRQLPRPPQASRPQSPYSRLAAVAAAARYLHALDPAPPSTARQVRLRELTAAPFTAEALRAQASAASLAQQLSRRGPTFMRGWLLGYRLVSYTRARARVAIWTVGLVASPAEVVAPQWSTTVCTLVWADGSWRVSDAQVTSGPTPPSAGADPAATAEFARAADPYRSFSDAP
jgi:hypothetical protein